MTSRSELKDEHVHWEETVQIIPISVYLEALLFIIILPEDMQSIVCNENHY